MTFEFSDHLDPVEYDAFVSHHPYGNLLQSSTWSRIKNNWDHRLAGLRNEEGALVAAALVLIRRFRFRWSLWYIPRGPIMDYSQRDAADALFSALKEKAAEDRCVFLKIDPPVFAHTAPFGAFEDAVDAKASAAKDMLESLGFRHQGFTQELGETIQPRYAAITFNDGRPMEERLSKRRLSAMKSAEKKMVRVERCGQDALDDFCYLIEKTEQAKNVVLRGKNYYARLMEAYGDHCFLHIAAIDLDKAVDRYERMKEDVTAKLNALSESAPKKRRFYEEQLESCNSFIALFREMQRKDGKKALLAGCLSVLYGPSFEILYAGFNRDYNRIPAQDPVYVACMNEAFARGAAYASMGGVSGNLKDGLMEYKSHFDPHVAAYLGEFDLPVRPFLYRLYTVVWKWAGHRLLERLAR